MVPDLPPELIELCFSFADATDAATCAAICASGTLGRRVCTPILYQSIGIVREDITVGDRSQKLQLLCRTLLENRDLARLARHAKQHLHEGTVSPAKVVWPVNSQRCLEFIDERHRLDDSMLTPLWESLVGEEASEEAYFVLMLLLCPQLNSLEFSGDLRVYKQMILLDQTMYPRIFSDPSKCNETKFFDIWRIRLAGGTSPEKNARIEDVLVVSQFPTLHTLTVETLDKGPPTLTIIEEDGLRSSTIRKLDIQECYANTDELKYLLSLCDDLQFLSIEWTMVADAHLRFDWHELGKALCYNCPEIQELRLDHTRWSNCDDSWNEIDEYESDWDDIQERLQGLGSLKRLKSLTHLTVTKNALLGKTGIRGYNGAAYNNDELEDDVFDERSDLMTLDQVLPDSLKVLTIVCKDKYIRGEAPRLLNDPRAAALEDMIVMNRNRSHWFSKKTGEGGHDPLKKSQRRSEGVAR